MFSRRIPADLSPNAWACARQRIGVVPWDLTTSNPTTCGLSYPTDLLSRLAAPDGLVYDANPLGRLEARQAVASEYRRRDVEVDPARIVLTASTSEAYALLFRLLGDPGDAVLIPTPSYPLLEHLVRLEGMVPRPYALEIDDRWQPAPCGIDATGAKALVVVHPNNPTGSFIAADRAGELRRLCGERGLALIADEVFFDYPLAPRESRLSFAGNAEVLTFTLGGLSKSVGLPQLKLAWIVVDGPAGEVDAALKRLSFIADQYLSVNTPVQLALGELLLRGAPVREAIAQRCRSNQAFLKGAARRAPQIEALPVEGGWNAVVRVPALVDDETLALALLERQGVAIFPGYLFDFPRDGYLVLSLLPRDEIFQGGVQRLIEALHHAT